MGLRSCDVEDVAQDALERVLQDGANLGPGGATSLARIVRGAARKLRRRTRREGPTRSGDVALDVLDECPDPEECAIERSRAAFLWTLLQKLDARRRRIVVRHELDGATLAEIAAQEGITEEAAQKRLAGARKELDDERIRWQSVQKRRGRSTSPVLLLPAQDVRATPRGRPSILRRLGLRSALHAIVAVAVVADAISPITWSPLRRAAPAPDTSTTAIIALPSAEVAPSPSVPSPMNHGPSVQAASRFDSRIRDSEQSLIERARAALATGGTANRMQVLALLKRHQRDFPNGRLATERDALLLKLMKLSR
jgi:RNA polymerase sigma-70 factor (ECF subfamily)